MLEKLLSSPFPKTICKTTSPFSGEIKVVQKGRERQLVVGGFVQSVNWDCPGVGKRVWGRIAAAVGCQKTLLVLGLGAGTELHLVSKECPAAQFTAIEIDPVIIRVSKDYFDLGSIPNLEIIEGDAFEYVKKTGKKFNTAVCDIYTGGGYPPDADSDAFLTKLSETADTVIFNRIFDSTKAPRAKEFLARLKQYFGGVEIVPIRHNALNILYICATLGDKKIVGE